MTAWDAAAEAIGRTCIRKLDRLDIEHSGNIQGRQAAYNATLCELLESLGFQSLVSR